MLRAGYRREERMTDNSAKYVASRKLAASEINGEAVILSLADGNFYGLNPVAAQVWRWLQEPRTLDQLESLLTAEFNVERDRARQDLTQLLRDLQTRKLIEAAA